MWNNDALPALPDTVTGDNSSSEQLKQQDDNRNNEPDSGLELKPDRDLETGALGIEEAIATLDELLEAELSALVLGENSAHLAIKAAFENSQKVYMVVQDVNEVCETIREFSKDHPIPMPECTDWPDSPPVSLFSMGELAGDDNNKGMMAAIFGLPRRRPLATASTVLVSLAMASVIYFGPETSLKFVLDAVPSSVKQVKTTYEINAAPFGSEPYSGALIASASASSLPQETPIIEVRPVKRYTKPPRKGGVTVVQKSTEISDGLDSNERRDSLVVRLAESNAVAPPVIENADKPVDIAKPFVGDDMTLKLSKAIQKEPVEEKLVASLGQFDVGVEPTLVKTVLITPKFSTQPELTNQPVVPQKLKRRSKNKVEQTMLNVRAGYTLTAEQKRKLVPMLVSGTSVANALQEVAVRVSPVLMRDLLTSLNSDC